MKLKITFRDLENWQEEYVTADFQHFFKEMKFQTMLMLMKIQKNKGVQARLINALKKTKSLGMQVLTMEITMEGIAGADLGSVTFEKENGNYIVYFTMDEIYFDIIEALKKAGQGFFGFGLVDKKQMIKDFHKALRKNITHKFTIEQLE